MDKNELITRYNQLEKERTKKQSEIDNLKGASQQILADIKKTHKVESISDAEKILKELEKTCEEYNKKLEEAYDDYQKEWEHFNAADY
jgi:multidrug resistance efflux pump